MVGISGVKGKGSVCSGHVVRFECAGLVVVSHMGFGWKMGGSKGTEYVIEVSLREAVVCIKRIDHGDKLDSGTLPFTRFLQPAKGGISTGSDVIVSLLRKVTCCWIR